MTIDRPSLEENRVLYGLTQEQEKDILESIRLGEDDRLLSLLDNLHAADIADLITHLSYDRRIYVVKVLQDHLDGEVLTHLEDGIRQEVLDALDMESIASAVAELDSDDALDVLEDLNEEQKEEVLRSIPAGERALLEEGLTYPEDSAGRLMQSEIVCVPPFWTAGEVLDFIRESDGLPRKFYDIYIVDPRHHPIGAITLSTLLRQPINVVVSDVMKVDLKIFSVNMDQEKVARSFNHYGLVSAPVVDEEERVVGMITVEDVVDVLEEEAEEDILHLAKVSESDYYSPVMTTAYWRIRWLFITLLSTLMASYVISRFEGSIHQFPALSYLMTTVAAMGGNSGMQVVTVVVRALATHSLKVGDALRAVRKEVSVGLIMGLFFGLILASVASLWLGYFKIGLVVGAAIFFNTIWAAFAGCVLPIVVARMGLDPAVGSGPILTTTTDILGYAIFLGLATHLLL